MKVDGRRTTDDGQKKIEKIQIKTTKDDGRWKMRTIVFFGCIWRGTPCMIANVVYFLSFCVTFSFCRVRRILVVRTLLDAIARRLEAPAHPKKPSFSVLVVVTRALSRVFGYLATSERRSHPLTGADADI